ncbi:MAG: hypothetical protein ACP5D7_16265 [Limnospira sp.]
MIVIRWIDTLMKSLKMLLKSIGELLGPCLVSLGAFLIFSCVEQTKEVYRVIIADSLLHQAILSAFLVHILASSIWYSAYLLYSTPPESNWQSSQQKEVNKILSLVIGYLPILGFSLGVLSAGKNIENANFIFSYAGNITFLFLFNALEITGFYKAYRLTPLPVERIKILFVNVVSGAFSLISLPLIAQTSSSAWGVIGIIILQLSLYLLLYFSFYDSDKDKENIQKNALKYALLFPGIYVGLASHVFPPSFSILIPVVIGPISLVAISFTILVVGISILQKVGDKNDFSAVIFLTCVLIFNGVTNVNDNHEFRQIRPSSDNFKSELPSLNQCFKEWLDSRPDRDQYLPEKPYPVYIISAQGGGIYAAYHAAITFASLTDEIPEFPQHIFAISGVSGGSLGASVFASLLKNSGDKNSGSISYAEKTKTILNQDFLSPLLSLGLFPDLFQRFIPFPINEWDRARGLEFAFENSWERLAIEHHKNPFRQSFYQYWKPEDTSPALVLNTTVVETGERLLISPFTMSSDQPINRIENNSEFPLVLHDTDLRLSTAVGLSARFPYITPVGWYRAGDDRSRLHLADGGYFDNSGISTALDIGRLLQQIDGQDNRFKIIYIALVNAPKNRSVNERSDLVFNEIFSPIRALFRAREARGRNIVNLSTYALDEERLRILRLRTVGNGFKLPVGWFLSRNSQNFIDDQILASISCDEESVGRDNSCIVKSIREDLT